MKRGLIIVLLVLSLIIVSGATGCPESTGLQAQTNLSSNLSAAAQDNHTIIAKPSQQEIANVKAKSIEVSYTELLGNPDKYYDKDVLHFKGEVLQLSTEGNNQYVLRVATKEASYGGYSEDVILVTTDRAIPEGSLVEVWGYSFGLQTYTAVLGNEVTVPLIGAYDIEAKDKAAAKVSKYSRTDSGITLSVNGYDFEKKGDTWGTIKTVDISIINKGAATIYPTLTVEAYNKGEDRNKGNLKEISLGRSIYAGESFEAKIPVDLDLSSINQTKVMVISISDYPNILINVNLETNVVNGFA